MSVRKRIVLAGIMSVFILALICVSPVQSVGVDRYEYSCTMTFLTPPDPTLDGWISGLGREGRFYWVNTGRFSAGETIHMYGHWGIEWNDGSWILGEHTGVWSLSNNRVNVRGVVTDASPIWSELIGRNVHTVEFFDMSTMSIGGIFQIN